MGSRKIWLSGSFNRTIVELKLVCSELTAANNPGFNRTIVELKSQQAIFGSNHRRSFNRTIVELKFKSTTGDIKLDEVLIVLL